MPSHSPPPNMAFAGTGSAICRLREPLCARVHARKVRSPHPFRTIPEPEGSGVVLYFLLTKVRRSVRRKDYQTFNPPPPPPHSGCIFHP